jgi:hypothetical protein
MLDFTMIQMGILLGIAFFCGILNAKTDGWLQKIGVKNKSHRFLIAGIGLPAGMFFASYAVIFLVGRIL